MNQNYIFSKDNNREYLLFIAIIPLYLYGIYKNGYLLYANKYINLFGIFKVVLYPLISALIGYLFGYIFKNKKRELLNFGVLAGLIVPFNFNMVIYFILVIGLLLLVALIPNKYKINELSLFLAILIVISKLSNNSLLFNPMELTNMYKFTLVDLFFGRGASLLYTSSIFWIICSYFVLVFIKTYKKNIFLISGFTFTILFLVYMIITKDYLNTFKLFLNGTTFFSLVYLAPINIASPSTDKEITIFSILLGIVSFILIFIFKVYTGSIIAVLILSVLYRIYCNFRQKMFFKKI